MGGGRQGSSGNSYNPSYDTPLAPVDEALYRLFKNQYAPGDTGKDYDYRGAYAAGETPSAPSGHFTDKFKKPNHPTFSVESQYAGAAPEKAGHWQGDTYVPHDQKLAVIIPETGAGKYWYVDPRANESPAHEDQGDSMRQQQQQALLDAMQRLLQPKAAEGTYQF